MKKCKKCGDKINITVFGAPDDICWECLSKEEKDSSLNLNVNISKIKNKSKK